MEATLGLAPNGLVPGHTKLLLDRVSMADLPGDMAWLHARRLGEGTVMHYVSNSPADTPSDKFRKLTTRSLPIESLLEECKPDLGLGHYKGRTIVGFRRQFLIVFVTQLFLQLMRLKFFVGFDVLPEKGKMGQDNKKTFWRQTVQVKIVPSYQNLEL
ncbi:MAG: hypothetical protein LBU69_00375 [Deltaproteobacteria bacterium]|jgi:hypothetical protein|nr:hypothetical protein [Deltaproteobacteria bacterium]